MKRHLRSLAVAAAIVFWNITPTLSSQYLLHQTEASWYGTESGRYSRTANGERYNPNGLTAAHRSLPFGTMVRVTNKKNGKSTVVRINDRGPFIKGRGIDLSRAAARAIDMSGVATVTLEILSD